MQSIALISPQHFTTLGELVRYLRERLELSQKELAIQVGYHYSYMSRIEKNQRVPDAQTLMTRFIPALMLEDEPQWTSRLLELADTAKSETVSTDSKPASPAPLTALPLFDLSASQLPIYLTPLLGRDAEVRALIELLNRPDVRLVTLLGSPGVGKTRLAVHVAAHMAGTFAHGPLFIDMRSATDPQQFLPALAQALGVIETSEAPLIRNIIAALRSRNLLLILDNFEHIVQAASSLPNILMSAPQVKMLVTSREVLHISAEHQFPLPSLPLPDDIQSTDTVTQESFNLLVRSAPVQLFTQRAQAVQPDFKVTPENISAIVEVCAKLDSLPLAIELAAARVKALSPQAMLQQLDRRLEWLTHGSRDAVKQTLRETIEWSYLLLSEPERFVLQRLSIFIGGCTLRAAEVICADPFTETAKVKREEVLDLIVKLIDKSLVTIETTPQQVRYRLLETVREFGREKLFESGDLNEVRTRYAIHCTEYTEEAESHLDGTEQAKWMRITEKEYGNFRAAMDYALTKPEILSYGLRIGAAVSLFWLERNYFQEGIERLNQLLEKAVAPEHQQARAKLLYRSAAIQARLFNYRNAHRLCQQSIEICRQLADQGLLASALFYFGEICTALTDYANASAALEESIEICRAIHFTAQLGMALTSLGRVLFEQGKVEEALNMTAEALKIGEATHDTWGLIHGWQFLGSLHRSTRDYEIAIHDFERSLPSIRELGDRFAEGVSFSNLSILYYLRQDYPVAGHAAEQAFVAFQAIGDEVQHSFPLRMMGYSAIQAGNFVRARALIRESLLGNREQNHLTGQLACLIALAACELANGNQEKALTYAAVAQSRLTAESISLMEPDALALENTLAAGKSLLRARAFKQLLEQSKDLQPTELIDAELQLGNFL